MLIRDCIRAVSEVFGVSEADLRGDAGGKRVWRARGAAMWLARREGHSWGKIAREFGNRALKTARNIVAKVGRWIDEDSAFARQVAETLFRLAGMIAAGRARP